MLGRHLAASTTPRPHHQAAPARAQAPRRPARACVKVQAGGFNFGANCPYTTLGVQANASDEAIKSAYRKLVLQYHPDVNHASGAQLKFMSIQQAYELVTNKARGGGGVGGAGGRRSDWAFHDWYWSFMQKRRWGGYKRGSAAAAAAAAATGEASQQQHHQQPPPHQQPQHQAAIRTQLAGLRHRAAIRANKRQPRWTAAAAAAGAGGGAEGSYDGGEAQEEQEQQQAGAAGQQSLEYDSSEMSDGCNMASGITDWQAAAEAHAAAAARKRFSASDSHRDQVLGQVAGLHRRAAASQEAASGLW